jgi:hypothetical protein
LDAHPQSPVAALASLVQFDQNELLLGVLLQDPDAEVGLVALDGEEA